MNLRQEVGGVKLNWRKLDSTADIKAIPFKDFSEVVVFVESDKDVASFLVKNGILCWHGNYIWFNQDGEYTGWDSNLDWYTGENELWNTIGTFFVPERKVAKILLSIFVTFIPAKVVN